MNSSEKLMLHLMICCKGWISELAINLFLDNLKGNKITQLLIIEYLQELE